MLPWYWEYLYGWWQELATGRQSGMGIAPLAWSEMDAWARRTRRDPTPDEWLLIRHIDALFVEVMNADTEPAKQHGRPGP